MPGSDEAFVPERRRSSFTMLSDADGHMLSPKESLELIALRARVGHLEVEKGNASTAAVGQITNNVAAFQAAGAGLYHAGMEAGRRASISEAEKIRNGNGLSDTHVVHQTGRVFTKVSGLMIDAPSVAPLPEAGAGTQSLPAVPIPRKAEPDFQEVQKLPRGSVGHVVNATSALASGTASNSIMGANEERRRNSGWVAKNGHTGKIEVGSNSEEQSSHPSATATATATATSAASAFPRETDLDNVGGEVVLKRTVERGFGILFGCANNKTVVSGIKDGR